MSLGERMYVTSCLPLGQPYPTRKSWLWLSQIPLSWEMHTGHSSFSHQAVPLILPFFFPHWAHPKLGILKIRKVTYVCVSHSFYMHTGIDATSTGLILPAKRKPVKWLLLCRNSVSVAISLCLCFSLVCTTWYRWNCESFISTFWNDYTYALLSVCTC